MGCSREKNVRGKNFCKDGVDGGGGGKRTGEIFRRELMDGVKRDLERWRGAQT